MKKKIEACHELYLNLQYKICLTNAYNLRLNMLTQTDNQEDLEQHKQLGKKRFGDTTSRLGPKISCWRIGKIQYGAITFCRLLKQIKDFG